MGRLLRDPLTHFVLLGLVALGVYEAFSPTPGAGDEIVVTRAEVDRLRAGWIAQWRRAPTEAELASLIDAWVQEEILYREALALGLDRNDTIVRRRLAQKMDFLGSDRGSDTGSNAGGGADSDPASPPDDETLASYLAENRERFRVPSLATFDQVYVSPDLRGDDAEDDARALLARLRDGADPASVGDRLLLPRHHTAVTAERVAQLFGDAFSAALQELPVGRWQGPVRSGYGLHLVYVEQREPARDPALEEVRERVRGEWEASRRERRLDAFHRSLRERYRVRIE